MSVRIFNHFVRSCNVVFPRISIVPESLCLPYTCGYYPSSVNASGPSCITPFGDVVTCNGTVVKTSQGGNMTCNCDGPVVLNSTAFVASDNITLDPTVLADYRPPNCSAITPASLPPTEFGSVVCNATSATKLCSYFQPGRTLSTPSTKCNAYTYNLTQPDLLYDQSGSSYICDGTLRNGLICRCDRSLNWTEVMDAQIKYGFVNPLGPPILLDCSSKKDALVPVDTAMKLIVQSGGVDLRPVIDLTPSL
jgi:hypothetical protein